jgi:ribonucleotide monophosphatase NagD (HAD superfamily)
VAGGHGRERRGWGGAGRQHFRRWQRAIGGRTLYHGKPHAGVYRRALALAGAVAPSRVLAVGDAMRTDVAGALAFGFDQVFISGGIHAEGLQAQIGTLPSPEAIADLVQAFGFAPTYVLAELRW